MLHIVLLILKIIGIILAVILGIIVLLFCVVFFVPLRYRVEAQADGTPEGIQARIDISWICHLISGYVIYQDKNVLWQMRIFWKKLNTEKKKPKKETLDETKNDTFKDEEADLPEPEESADDKQVSYSDDRKESDQKKQTNPSDDSEQSAKWNQPHDSDTFRKSEKKVRQKRRKKKKNIFQKIKYTFQNICDKIQVLLEKKEKLEEFLTDTVHVSAFSRIKKEIFRLLRFLKPDKLKANIHFGLEDPYNTGCVLAGLGMLYPFYGESIHITPDFEEQILEGELFLKGHVRGVYALILIWNLLFDKNVRTAYKHIRAFKF